MRGKKAAKINRGVICFCVKPAHSVMEYNQQNIDNEDICLGKRNALLYYTHSTVALNCIALISASVEDLCYIALFEIVDCFMGDAYLFISLIQNKIKA